MLMVIECIGSFGNAYLVEQFVITEDGRFIGGVSVALFTDLAKHGDPVIDRAVVMDLNARGTNLAKVWEFLKERYPHVKVWSGYREGKGYVKHER